MNAELEKSAQAVRERGGKPYVIPGGGSNTIGALGYVDCALELARQAMERANVWHLADRQVNELSGGERQRVIIAQALAQDTGLLLLDEPTQHLDINHQLSLLEMLSSMCSRGVAVIMVMHDLNLASQYCDRIIVMLKGREYARGEPAQVLTAGVLREVFGVGSIVTRHAVTGRPHVVFLPTSDAGAATGPRVHLICGGASGASFMRELLERGLALGFDALATECLGDLDGRRGVHRPPEGVADLGGKFLHANGEVVPRWPGAKSLFEEFAVLPRRERQPGVCHFSSTERAG